MTTDEVLAELAERRLELRFREDGTPYLHGPRLMATDALLRVLRHHRREIIRRLRPPPSPPLPRPREWRWRFDQRHIEDPRDTTYGDPNHHPTGAWWWRYQGETDDTWRPVPGRAMAEAIRLPQEGERGGVPAGLPSEGGPGGLPLPEGERHA
jgi:hypothetical protein